MGVGSDGAADADSDSDSDSADATDLTLDLSDGLDEWLDETADARGVSRERVLRDLLAAHRDVQRDASETPAEAESLAAIEGEFQEKLEDVRERILQVKRATEAKASADHGHDDLRADLADLTERVETAEAGVASLEETVGDLRSDLEGGFENYETVLSGLTDEVETLRSRTERLARAMQGLREAVESVERTGENADVAALARTANRSGVRNGTCENCARQVDIALLTEPTCPHCAAGFAGLETDSGFLGFGASAVLRTAEQSALPAGEKREAVPDVDGGRAESESTGPGEGETDNGAAPSGDRKR